MIFGEIGRGLGFKDNGGKGKKAKLYLSKMEPQALPRLM